MTHDHHHHGNHGHSHGHDAHEPGGEMSFDQKIARILEHWMQHNDEHIRSYREWAEKARSHGMAEAADRIEAAAAATAAVTEAFQQALAAAKKA